MSSIFGFLVSALAMIGFILDLDLVLDQVEWRMAQNLRDWQGLIHRISCGRYEAGLYNIEQSQGFLQTLGLDSAAVSQAVTATRYQWQRQYSEQEASCSDMRDSFRFYNENNNPPDPSANPLPLNQPNWRYYLPERGGDGR